MEISVLFILSKRHISHLSELFPNFKEKKWDVRICEDFESAFKIIQKKTPTLIFAEASYNKSYAEEILKKKKEIKGFPEVIVLSEEGSSKEAEKFLSMGAKDYWLLPLLWDKIKTAVELIITQKKEFTLEPSITSSLFIGEDKKIKKALGLAKRIAFSDTTVLILGESGTGKEVLAKFIHHSSPRKNKPFIAINCAALPIHLLESELFGYEKGAFTGAIQKKAGKFELADGGTLLLDEISEMDLSLQAKLLRVLQEKEIDRLGGTHTIKVDVRILATTNKNLEECVKKGEFREDLYYRINVIPIYLPPLRERGDDVILLANHFIKEFCNKYSLPIKILSPRATKWIKEYHWPGNVRQLKNYMERGVLLSEGEIIEPEHLEVTKLDFELESEKNFESNQTSPIENEEILPLYEVEKRMILKSLNYTKGNRTKAAELLGISVRTLRNKLNEYKRKGEI